MRGRPTWQGHLKLSLVTCPVALYTATERTGDVHFHMLSAKTHNRIRMIPTDPETGPIERDDIVKGYEIEKDRYVIVTDDEIDAVRLESTAPSTSNASSTSTTSIACTGTSPISSCPTASWRWKPMR